MTWQCYYNESEGETKYYHDGDEIVTLAGKNTKWLHGFPLGEHSDDLRSAIQDSGDDEITEMLFDLHKGIQRLDSPL